MVSQKVTNSLECAFSLDKHISMQPITLSCGHNVCKQCIPLNGNHKLPCIHCQKLNQIDLRLCDESSATKCLFDLVLNKLYPIVEDRFRAALSQLKECRKTFEENLGTRIDYVRKEIETRIGTLKHELDQLQVELIGQIDEIKDKIFNTREKSRNFIFELEHYEMTFAKLQEDIQKYFFELEYDRSEISLR